MKTETKKVTLECPHCGNIWDYKGQKKIKVNCTDCRQPFDLKDNIYKPEDQHEI